jgi:hypothetical protein
MMFMMPMPPTRRLMAATAASRAVSVRVAPRDRVGDLLLVHDVEVVVCFARQTPPLAQQAGDILLRFFRGHAVADRELHLIDVFASAQPALHRPQRNDHGIVAILPELALAFRFEQADDTA